MRMMLGAAGGSLDPQGPAAESAADLWWLMLPLGVVVFLVFAVLLVGGLWHRRGNASDDPDAGRRLVSRWIVGGGVVMPTVVIVVILVATLQAMRATPVSAPADALSIHVVGHQFWYEVRYPDHGIVTANELHLPVGRPVEVRLDSDDVIHSFWVPALAGKVDLIPERTNTLVLQADQPGEHKSLCAEFCGLQHARMGMIVVAEPEDEFAAWVESHQRPHPEPDGASALRGERIFFDADCARCHTLAGTAADGTSGPDLTHLADRRTLGAASLPNTPDNLARWIRDPQAIKTGIEMPATDLSDAELEALLDYLGVDR